MPAVHDLQIGSFEDRILDNVHDLMAEAAQQVTYLGTLTCRLTA
jgi:hypothetical protein